jgi:hypothetical protein
MGYSATKPAAPMRGETTEKNVAIKTAEAKKIVRRWLDGKGMDNRITANTVSFQDLARADCIFVKVHKWKAGSLWLELKKLAIANGFRVETPGGG